MSLQIAAIHSPRRSNLVERMIASCCKRLHVIKKSGHPHPGQFQSLSVMYRVYLHLRTSSLPLPGFVAAE